MAAPALTGAGRSAMLRLNAWNDRREDTLARIAFACAAGILWLATLADPASAAPRDRFFWLSQINRASAVMIVERGIVPRPLGAKIFDAITRVDAAGDAPGAARASDYLKVEQDLMAAGGPDISRLHSGRSRQDIGVDHAAADHARRFPHRVREAERHARRAAGAGRAERRTPSSRPTPGACRPSRSRSAIISRAMPRRSNAPPTRMREAYVRLNVSPLGRGGAGNIELPGRPAAAGGIARLRWVAENSLDANQISPIDGGAEIAGLATAGALTLGALIADVTAAICPDRTLDPAGRRRG